MTNVHLFPPQGTLPPDQRAFLRDVSRFLPFIATAVEDIIDGVDAGDMDRALAGVRRLESVGYLLGRAGREVGEGT